MVQSNTAKLFKQQLAIHHSLLITWQQNTFSLFRETESGRVTAVGKKVLDKIAERFGHEFTYDETLIGHVAIEATGNPLPDESLEKMRKSDAVLFGAVGHPKYDNDPSAKVRPEQGLLKMRKELGLYANLRPIKLFDELLDASSIKPEILKVQTSLFFRELTGDIYFGERQKKE